MRRVESAVYRPMRTSRGIEYYRREKRRREKRKVIVRKISGFAAVLFFVLILGKAGQSDLGAAWETIFPSTLIYTILFVIAFHVWEYCGGNDPANWKN